MNSDKKIVTVHHSGPSDAFQEEQQTSCCFSWFKRLLRRLRGRLSKRGSTVPKKDNQVALPTEVAVPALRDYYTEQKEAVPVTAIEVYIPPLKAAPALPHPCLVFLFNPAHLREPAEGMAFLTTAAAKTEAKVTATVARPPQTLTIIIYMVKREIINKVEELVAEEEPRPLKGIFKKGNAPNTAHKCLRFNFKNLNTFVKDRELYCGFDYFRYGVPLSDIRSHRPDSHVSHSVRGAPRHHQNSQHVRQNSARNAGHSRLYGHYLNDTATGANNSYVRPHSADRRYFRARNTRANSTPGCPKYSGKRKPH